jgi:hypothetical protein
MEKSLKKRAVGLISVDNINQKTIKDNADNPPILLIYYFLNIYSSRINVTPIPLQEYLVRKKWKHPDNTEVQEWTRPKV